MKNKENKTEKKGSIRVALQAKAQNGTFFIPVPNNIALSVVNPKWGFITAPDFSGNNL